MRDPDTSRSNAVARLSKRARRIAASWLVWLVERGEVSHLDPQHRDAVAAEVAVAIAEGWPNRLQPYLVRRCFIPLLVLVLIRAPSWAFWIICVYAVGPSLIDAGLDCMSRRLGLRRLRAVLDREARGPSSSAVLLWAPVAAELRGQLELARSDRWGRARAAAWRSKVCDAPEAAGVNAIRRYDLAVEAAGRATKDPLVRTLWVLGFILFGFFLPALLGLTAAMVATNPFLQGLAAPSLLVFAAAPALLVAAEIRGRRLTRGFFRELLLAASLRPARCFVCRSDLTGVTASRCPACGAAIAREA